MPDFNYINRIPIVDVAKEIYLEIRDDGRIVCWRHGDSKTTFLRVLQSNKVQCDTCDSDPMSVLDLVQAVGQFDSLVAAAECLDTLDLDIPRIAKGSHLKNFEGQAVPPATGDPIGLLVLSGIWANLSESTQRLIPPFLALGKWDETGQAVIRLSYRAMSRYSGIKSPNAIKAALDELDRIGWLERLETSSRGESPIKDTAEYRLTPLSQSVKELANATAPAFGEAIKTEKSARKRKRQDRERKFQSDNSN